jgi:hypothetical protein
VTVDKLGNVKLGSFHRARGIKDITTSVNGEIDGVRWLCPKKINDSSLPYSKAADVYRYVI